MRRSKENSFTLTEPSSGSEMKYLAGGWELQWGRAELSMYCEVLLPQNTQYRTSFVNEAKLLMLE